MSSSVNVSPDDLTSVFQRLGLRDGMSVMLHASLESMGNVDGGAAMFLHRLLGVLGKKAILIMPTFTSITRHATAHDDFTKLGCWCEGVEARHIPFIREVQPDKEIGAIAHRLCSWPGSRQSEHAAYSFVAVGYRRDDVVNDFSYQDPLLPVRKFLKHDPVVLTIGVGLNSVTLIHLAEERFLPQKFSTERALTVSSKGQSWVEIRSIGCSHGFEKLRLRFVQGSETNIGFARAVSYSMKRLIDLASSMLKENNLALLCDRANCLSCAALA